MREEQVNDPTNQESFWEPGEICVQRSRLNISAGDVWAARSTNVMPELHRAVQNSRGGLHRPPKNHTGTWGNMREHNWDLSCFSIFGSILSFSVWNSVFSTSEERRSLSCAKGPFTSDLIIHVFTLSLSLSLSFHWVSTCEFLWKTFQLSLHVLTWC